MMKNLIKTSAWKLIAPASLLLLICGVTPSTAQAQNSTSTGQFAPLQVEPTNNEITVAGTIQQVISTSTPDLRVSLLTPQGIFTTDFGPSLAKDIKPVLTTGQQLQVTGAIQTINGQTVLFARLLTVNDRLVIVRNEHGFPVHTTSSTLAAAQAIKNGDAK